MVPAALDSTAAPEGSGPAADRALATVANVAERTGEPEGPGAGGTRSGNQGADPVRSRSDPRGPFVESPARRRLAESQRVAAGTAVDGAQIDRLRRRVTARSRDTSVHVARIHWAVEHSDPDEVWGALVDLFLLVPADAAGIRGRALFWGRPLLSGEQHRFLTERLDIGIAADEAIAPAPRRSLHWKGVVGAHIVRDTAQPVVQRSPDAPVHEPLPPASTASALAPRRPVRASAPAQPRGSSGPGGALPRLAELAEPSRATTPDPRVAAALASVRAELPLEADDRPRRQTGETLVDLVIRVVDAVADDRRPRALTGPGGSLQFHPNRTVEVGVSEMQLNAWCEPPMRPDEIRLGPTVARARGHRLLSWLQLRWDLGSRCATGSFPGSLNLDAPLVLTEVPTLTGLRRLSGDHQVIALLRERPMTIDEVRAEGVELRHLAAMVWALHSSELLSQDPRDHVDDDGGLLPDEPSTWFERLRAGFGGT